MGAANYLLYCSGSRYLAEDFTRNPSLDHERPKRLGWWTLGHLLVLNEPFSLTA